MKNSSRQSRTVPVLFAVTVFLFSVFFAYMTGKERVSVFQPEQTHTYAHITDFQLEQVADSSSPTGIRKVYRGILDPALSPESCLCFNIAHHTIAVYFDDVLVYRLTGSEENRIGKNVSSNWCSVHVGQDHAGKAVTIVLTPLFEAAIGKNPDFLLGSHYAIAIDLLRGELPLLVLSTLCLLLGFFVVAVVLYFRLMLKTDPTGLVYLGLFSIFLGLWKVTDLRSMPLLLPAYSMAIGYVSVGSLFLTGICLIAYCSTLFAEKHRILPNTLLFLACCMCVAVLICQVSGVAEIRQNLVYCHTILIAAILSLPVTAICNRVFRKTWGLIHSWKLLLLLVTGIALDLVLYYWNNGLLSFSIMGFILYTLVVFLSSIQEATRKAYIDSRTGLENRTRWNELMSNESVIPEPYAILVIDLNGLKHVNDALGHDAGDRMIYELSEILRNSLPRNCVICRWGGDEFAVLLSGLTKEMLEQHVASLRAAEKAYNLDHPELPIRYSIGAALSSDHPGISRSELFRLADEDMYHNKQLWYANNKT